MSKKAFRIHFHVHDALSLKGLPHDLKIWLKASFQNFLQFPNLHLLVKVQCSVYSHHKMKWIVFKSFVLDLGQSHKSGSGFITIVTFYFYFYFNICMIDKKYNEYYAPH